MEQERVITGDRRPEDLDAALRPKTLDEFVGQKAARENLRVFIEAAKSRGDALDHVLFFGPPGLGKTTLAQIIARELGVGFRATSGPVIAKSGDLAAMLTNLEDGDVLFIDEIHRLAPAVEEILYPAMEDRVARPDDRRGAVGALGPDRPAQIHPGRRDHAAGADHDAAARPLRHSGPAQLLFGRGARAGRAPRRRGCSASPSTEDGAREVARRSRGTPRIAGRLLRRVRDFAQSGGRGGGERQGRRRAR